MARLRSSTVGASLASRTRTRRWIDSSNPSTSSTSPVERRRPPRSTPLIISVDDLRPLRGESHEHQRINQLRRAVDHGALLVASTRSASHEVQRVLGVERAASWWCHPPCRTWNPTVEGTALVVNLTGVLEPFLKLSAELVAFAQRRGSRVEAVASSAVAQRIRARGVDVTLRSRGEARAALADARVVLHISDGARFPSFAIAALAAGVPTIARATAINRELLERGGRVDRRVTTTFCRSWRNSGTVPRVERSPSPPGRSRAQDFAPATAARAYVALYREVVRG